MCFDNYIYLFKSTIMRKNTIFSRDKVNISRIFDFENDFYLIFQIKSTFKNVKGILNQRCYFN